MKIRFYGNSDVGRKREINEDSYVAIPKQGLFVVCDGMGGHAAGEVASKMAVDTITDFYEKADRKTVNQVCEDIATLIPDFVKKIIGAIRLANRRIYNFALMSGGKAGMGTTVVTALFQKNFVIIAHIGDSRVYRIRNRKIQLLTEDHSYVNDLIRAGEITTEAVRQLNIKNVITRALGTKYAAKIDLKVVDCMDNDVFILCTDGLVSELSDETINDVVLQSHNVNAITNRLIERANARGGSDNITVITVEVVQVSQAETVPRFATTIDEEPERIQKSLDRIIKKRFGIRAKNKLKKIPLLITAFAAVALIVLGIVFIGMLTSNKENETKPVLEPQSIEKIVRFNLQKENLDQDDFNTFIYIKTAENKVDSTILNKAVTTGITLPLGNYMLRDIIIKKILQNKTKSYYYNTNNFSIDETSTTVKLELESVTDLPNWFKSIKTATQ